MMKTLRSLLIISISLLLFVQIGFAQIVHYDLDFSSESFTTEVVDGYTVVSTKEKAFTYRETPGYPALPVRMVTLAIPNYTVYADHNIDIESSSYLDDVLVYPFQPPVPTDGSVTPWVKPIPEVYGSDGVFPTGNFQYTSYQDQGQYRFITFEICPFKYFPSEKRVELITHVSLDLTLVSGEPNTNRPDNGTMYSLLQRVVDNPEALVLSNSKSPVNPNDVQYLIITDADMIDDFQPLANWKTQKGIPAEVISIQSVLTNYTGATDQLKIKTCLQDYYTNKGLQWVLLGGDNTVVPDQDCYGIVNAYSSDPYSDNTIPTDLFYCCFDNAFDWNADGDTQVGEVEDNVDLAPEVFVGRAPVQTEMQAAIFVAKTLNYEQNPPANNFATDYISSGLELWNTWGGHSDADWRSEAMWNEIIAPIWTGTKYKYYDTDTDFTGGDTYDITAQHTSDLLNDGYNYFWMATHGGQTSWGMETGDGFYSSHAAALTNLNTQGLVITMACNTNAFETSVYGNDPCLSEAFLRNGNGGAVMYHGSSRYGWGNGDAVLQHGSSMEFARDFFNALFAGNPTAHPQAFAAVSAESKLNNIGNAASENSYRWLMFSINNMGDPELPVLTQNPLDFVVSLPAYVFFGIPQNIEVSTSVPGALVCISDAHSVNPVYAYAYTDVNGSCTLQVIPNQDYPLSVTVTAPNYTPSISTIISSPATEPFVMVDEIIPSTSNGDATIEAGETATFDVRIINYGGVTANNIVLQLAETDPDNFITLTDSDEIVAESLPAGDTLVITAAFSLNVAMNVTNNYGITLSTGITFSSKDMTWYPQDFTVYSYVDPVYLTSISGSQRIDLSWRAPFGGWKSYYPGGGWFAHDTPQRAMLYQAADFDLSYPIEISSLASRFSEYEAWGGNNTFRFNIYDVLTEELLYQTDWIIANANGYTYFYLDYPLTISGDFYLSVEVNDLINGYPVSVVSAPMEPEDTHCYVGSPGDWTKSTYECSSYIYVIDAVSTGTKELSYQQNQLTQQNPASDLTLGKGPKFSFQGYNLYRDDVKINSTPITDNSYTDEPLSTDLYSYYVTAVYAEGESCASNEIIAASLDANTVFYDHFDGTAFWTCDDGCGWNNTINEYYSATASYTDSPDGNYLDNMDCSTWTATPVSLMNVNAEVAIVSYYAKYAIELDYDTCFFEITTNIETGDREVLGFYTGVNSVWTEYTFDISDYIGNDAIYFIFRMNTDEMVTDDGIYIDDFLVTVAENGFAPARNIEANLYDIDVHLSWSPPMSGGEGWFSHWRWSTHYSLSSAEKGAYINLAEFGNAYPMMLEKIKHQFYDPNNNNWEGNNRFTFRIYNKNGIDLVYESPQIEAVAWENEYTLPVPFELTDDVLIAVAPVSSDGGPYSLSQADWGNSSRSYIGDAITGWNQKNGNWATEIYITNSLKSDNSLWNQSGVALQNVNSKVVKESVSLPLQAEDLKKAPRFNGNQSLAKNVQGYNVFRNGSQMNGALVTNTWFIDNLPYQGLYNYTVTAVYTGSESVETVPQYIDLDDVVVMIPPVASAFDEVTLWFDPAYSCEAGSANSLENFGEVWMHSGMGINGTTWNNVVPWDNLGVNSQSPQLVLNSNGQASITYTPFEFYGTSVDQTLQDQLCMVFNGGNLAQAQFSNPWEKTGKITDEYGNCADIFIPLEYRDTLFIDDFESGISKWSVSGDWALCEAEFFSPTHCLTDSPDGNYSSPSDTYAAMNSSVDLSQKARIVLEFKTLYGLNENDFVYVEISNDDFASSEVIYTFSYSNWKPWDNMQLSLDTYSGFDNVKIRFHCVVQNPETNNGIFIDDVLIKAVDGYFMIADIIPHTTDGDENFEANETATLDVVIVNGGALSLSNVPLTLSKTDADGFITLTDNVCTIESMNPGERDTIFDAFSLDVAIGVTTSYPFTLSVGADIPSDDMQWFDFNFFAFSNLYPLNLVAENDSNDISLSWQAPFCGWYTYQQGGSQGTHWSEEERATLIQASDFDLTYPLYFSSIAHRFFESPEYPWNGNNTFRYNLYDYTAGTLLYQSDWMQAPTDGYAYLDFDEPMLVNGDFFISVEVQDAGNSDFPSSCRNEGTTHPQSHSYLGSPGNWVTFSHEWITYLYITGDGGLNGTGDHLTVGYDNGSPFSGISANRIPENGKTGNAKSDIIGFNIYRDGVKINGDQPIEVYSYLDSNLPLGGYEYQTTAVYSDGESCFSNMAIGNVTDPDVVFFEDFEGYNEEDWNCGWDFTEVDSHSSSHSLANGPNGNYADNQDCYVKVDPPVNLLNINADSAVLSFWAKYDIEENVDTCFLEVTSDFWGSEHVPIGYFTGTNSSWQEYSFDISNFIGKSLVYIFRMKTNESINFDGIYIDDVTVRVYGNDNAPARNFEAFAYGADMHLEWEAPMAGGEGWFSNWRWTTAYTINNTEMASYFDMSEFGNSYPMTLEKIKHHFYDANGDDWGGQDQYIIKIYEKDGTTVLYESGNLFADNGANEFTLPTPLELTDDILISIVPATNYPSSCLMNDVNNPSHGYMGNFDEGWTSINGNFATEIYVTYPGAKSTQGKYWGVSGIELGNISEEVSDNSGFAFLPSKIQATLPTFKGNTTLAKNILGFNVYRNESLVNASPVTNNYYYDTIPHQGIFDYSVKALYAGGESVGTVHNTFTLDDVVLAYPLGASPGDSITLWFAPEHSCEAGQTNSLEGSSEVRLHSGLGVDGSYWTNTISWEGPGINGQSTLLDNQPNDLYSISLRPTGFYGVNPESEIVDHLIMTLNGGYSTPAPYDKTGMAPDGSGGCVDIIKNLDYRSVIFEDDFESGLDNWTLTGSWGLADYEFYTVTHSLTDSPFDWYSAGIETSATMANGVSLVGYVHALLEFNFMHGLGNGDYVTCEISTNDFQSVDVLATYTFWEWKPWKSASISLENYENQSNVKIRFRLTSDEGDESDGIFIDDFSIKGYYNGSLIENIPYNQDFTVYPTPDWDMFAGELTANSSLTPYTITSLYDGWHQDGFGCTGGNTGAIRGNIWTSNHYFWYNTPFVDLGAGDEDMVIQFDMAGNIYGNCNQATLAYEDEFAVVICTDGVTWSEANTLIEWGEGDTFPVNGETYQVDLSGYSGIVRFGFYHGHNSYSTDIEVFVDNVFVGIGDTQMTIAEARLLPVGTEVTITGVVSNSDELGNIRYFQDATAGIAAYGSAQAGTIYRGDQVTYNGVLMDYNGLLELQPINNMTVLASGVALANPVDIEPSDYSEAIESQLVVTDTAFFVTPDLIFTFDLHQYVGPQGDTGVVSPRYSSNLFEKAIPDCPVAITGILSQYSPTDPTAGYRVILRDSFDIVLLPLPVRNGSAIVNNNDVAISWDVPIAGQIIPGLDGYNVYRAISHTAPFENAQKLNADLLQTLSYQDVDVANDNYSYWIETVYEEGVVGLSDRLPVVVIGTVVISGNVTEEGSGNPIQNALVSFGTAASSVYTDVDGSYEQLVPSGASFLSSVSLTGYTFSPELYTYVNVVTDYTDQDFQGNSSGFPPGWNFVNTGSNHTLNIQSTAPLIDGLPLSFGSFIGVFYMDNGVEKCGGAIEWQGAASPILPAYGDDATTPEKDGFSEGEDLIWKFYTSDVKGTELYATAIYSMGPNVYQTNGSSVVPSVQANTSISQTVALSDGWSGISSYVIPENDSTTVLFEPVAADLVILKSMTQAYWPPYANQIEHWNTYEGYKLKMNNSGEITFTGIDSEKSFPIINGWSLLPVLTNQNVEVLSFFAPVLSDLVIVKSIDGLGVYWPEVNVQTLQFLEPGKSYMVKMNSSGVLSFPALSSKQYTNTPGYPGPVASEIWNNPVNTGITHTLVFNNAACGNFADGDLVGAFNYQGVCVGVAEYTTGIPLSISVYGDDPLTDAVEGYLHYEAFVLKQVQPDLSVNTLTPSFSSKEGLSNCFVENGLSLIVDVQSSPNGIESLDLSNAVVYPNPTNDMLTIRLVGNASAEVNAAIITLQGRMLQEKLFMGETELHLGALPSGIYLLQLRDNKGYVVYRRITKQ